EDPPYSYRTPGRNTAAHRMPGNALTSRDAGKSGSNESRKGAGAERIGANGSKDPEIAGASAAQAGESRGNCKRNPYVSGSPQRIAKGGPIVYGNAGIWSAGGIRRRFSGACPERRHFSVQPRDDDAHSFHSAARSGCDPERNQSGRRTGL